MLIKRIAFCAASGKTDYLETFVYGKRVLFCLFLDFRCMKRLIIRLVPSDDRRRFRVSVGLTVLLAGLLTLWAIYGMEQYGIALFVLIPILTGAIPAILYGIKGELTYGLALRTGFIALAIYTLGLFVFAIEGMICIAMAAPIGIVLTWIGVTIGYAVSAKKPSKAAATVLILVASVPITAFIEGEGSPRLNSVVTSVEIRADAGLVWQNVVEFPVMKEPAEFLFKTGIAYPVDATIAGTGVGAVRHCNFTTGSFVEPVTVWDEPRLLKFDVRAQPAPMKELSLWDVDAPHLHDYFISRQGQFRIIPLANGNVKLEGTTWYYHKISPAFYWQFWSEYIIHRIHERVLNHIKVNAEQQ